LDAFSKLAPFPVHAHIARIRIVFDIRFMVVCFYLFDAKVMDVCLWRKRYSLIVDREIPKFDREIPILHEMYLTPKNESTLDSS